MAVPQITKLDYIRSSNFICVYIPKAVESMSQRNFCVPICIATLFPMAKMWEANHLFTDRQMNKFNKTYILTVEILQYITTWLELKDIILK